jgi:hypothetical protein
MVEDHCCDGAIRFLVRLVLLCFLLALKLAAAPHFGNQPSGRDSKVPSSPTRIEVSHAIALAAGYLERSCGPDGKFAYKVDIGSGRESSSYDIIRHAGAMYALAMVNRSQPDPQAVAAILRAAKFLRQNYIGPGVRPGQLVVWSQPLPEVSGYHRSKAQESYAELGGTGLGLVALAAARQVDPESVTREELQSLGRFALFLQRDNGSFVNKYGAESGPVPKWTSLYYPGEAALGFIELYEVDHSREWLTAADKALSYLAKSRAGLTTVPADHWALIATAKLLHHCDRTKCTASRDELVQHAIQVCKSILREQYISSAASGLDGAFDPAGRTAPTATRLEGLLSALEFLQQGDLREKIEKAVGRGIGFLLRAQNSAGKFSGGIPGQLYGGPRSDVSAIRIDYVQHALCAWLLYRRLLLERTTPLLN